MDKTDVSRTISVLVLRVTEVTLRTRTEMVYPEDEDGDGSRNVGFIHF
jgi:hypothetical protein